MAHTPTFTALSFGYLHTGGRPPAEATVVIDVRVLLRDPHVDPALRALTGQHPAVQRKVLSTPGALELLERLTVLAASLMDLAAPTGTDVVLALGCAGGRHRSYVLAARLARYMARAGYPARAEHRHAHLPVVAR